MDKKNDLADVCKYLKGIVIPQIPENFVIAEQFRYGLSDDELKMGIKAFREFLCALYDKLAAEKNRFDPKKAELYDPDNGEESLWKCFPIIKDISALLFFVGIHGKLETGLKKELSVHGKKLLTVLKPKTEKFFGLRKLTGKRLSSLFELLCEMGFSFEDADFSKSVDLSKTGVFYVKYEEDENLIMGLKLIAKAQANIKSDYDKLGSAFMRCDFYPLENETPQKHTAKIADCVNWLPPKIRDWIMNLDKYLTENDCRIDNNFSDSVHFIYISRKSKKWVCKIEMRTTGCLVKPNCNNSNSIVPVLTENMINILKARFCIKCTEQCKVGGPFELKHNGKTNKICRFEGFKFPIDNVDERKILKKWIEMELAV